MNVILIAVIVLGLIGLVSALVLFIASHKFAVHEDPRIGQVAEVLPQANCGGCGYPGCSGFAAACVKAADAGSLDGKLCPVGGQVVMEQVAKIVGLEVKAAAPQVAVVRCNGTCENRPSIAEYNGARSCRVQAMTGMGETACAYGCLEEIIALQQQLSLERNREDIGKTFEVLVEGVSKRSPNQLFGRNSQNKVIIFDKDDHQCSWYPRFYRWYLLC